MPYRGGERSGSLDREGKNGATISAVIDYLQPYLSDPKKWNKEQIGEFSSEGLYYLAFSGMGLETPRVYVALSQAGAR